MIRWARETREIAGRSLSCWTAHVGAFEAHVYEHSFGAFSAFVGGDLVAEGRSLEECQKAFSRRFFAMTLEACKVLSDEREAVKS
jgi:hypothetical protein